MIVFIVFFILSAAVFCAAVICRICNRLLHVAVCFVLAYAFLLASACAGVNFSPSFTAIFLWVCFALNICGECISIFNPKGKAAPRMLSIIISVVGSLFVFPSVYIYAAGDDWLTTYCLLSVVGAVALPVLISLLQWKTREKSVPVYAAERMELVIFSASAVFALLCAISSPALLPYGLGLALLTASRCFKNKFIRSVFVYCGIVLSAWFLWSPMIF